MEHQAKLQDITMGGILRINNRILTVKGIWWSDSKITQVDFYEPATDKINEVTYQELFNMIESGALKLHQPLRGKVIKARW